MATEEQSPLDRIRQRIAKFKDEAKWDRVIREYEALLDFFPRDADVHNQYADALFKAGQGLSGVTEYFTAAQIYEESGARDKAIPMLKKVLKLKPSLRELNVRIGDLYAKDNRIPEALEYYKNGYEYFTESGQSHDALAIQRKIVNLQPDDVVNHRKLAEAYEAQGMNNDAIHEYRQLVKKMKSLGLYSESYSLLSRIIKLQPSSFQELCELAKMYLSNGDTKSASAQVREILALNPEYPEAFLVLGTIMKREGDLVRAAKAYQKYLGHFPKNKDVLIETAGLLCDTNQPQATLELCLRYVDLVDIKTDEQRSRIMPLVRRLHDIKPADITFQERYVTLLSKIHDTEWFSGELRYLASLYKLAGFEDKADKALALLNTRLSSRDEQLPDGTSSWRNHEMKHILPGMIDPFVPLASLGFESFVENIITGADDFLMAGGVGLIELIPKQARFKRDKRQNFTGLSQIKIQLARSLVQMQRYKEAIVELSPLITDEDVQDQANALMGICQRSLGDPELAEVFFQNVRDRSVLDKLKAYGLLP